MQSQRSAQMHTMTPIQPATPQEIKRRLTELEIKASFTEDLLDKLDQIVIRQQTQIEALISEVLHLRQQIGNAHGDTPRNLRDELPPHY
jgi:SlyX protein